MSFKLIAVTPMLAMCAAAGAIALGAPASADPGPCTDSGAATVCESPGSSSIVVQPSTGTEAGGAANQNGIYGPYGDVPPVGRGN